MAQLVPPIVIDNSRDGLEMYASVTALVGYLEHWYATDEDFTAYDREGRLLEVAPDGYGVQVRALEETPTHEAALREALLRHLRETRENASSFETMALSQLVDEVLADGRFVVSEPGPGLLARLRSWLRGSSSEV